MSVNNYGYIYSLDKYFDEIKKIRKLTVAEERELGLKIKKGDEEALNKLVKHNLKFVVSYVKKYRDLTDIPYDELISEGNIGLIRAAKKFDPDKKIKFISYAVWWVKAAINEYISKFRDPNEIIIEDKDEIIRLADKNEIYENINSDFEKQMANRQTSSYLVSELVKCLEERERKIIIMFFGLNGNKEMNLREISEELSITEERVRQIKDDAIVKLRCEALTSKEILNNNILC